MKSAIAPSLLIASTSTLTIPSSLKEAQDALPYHHALLKAIHKRDLAARATDDYGNKIGSSEGCWVPNCNDYYGGTWIGSGPEPYSPEWFAQSGISGSSSSSTGSVGSSSSSSSVVDSGTSGSSSSTGSSGTTLDTSSSSTTDPSTCAPACADIMSAAQSCATSTDIYCGCQTILSMGRAWADCFQPINSTYSVVILDGIQSCNTGTSSSASTGSTGTTGTTGTTVSAGSGSPITSVTGSKTTGGAGGAIATTTATNGAKTSGTAAKVSGSSGAGKVVLLMLLWFSLDVSLLFFVR